MMSLKNSLQFKFFGFVLSVVLIAFAIVGVSIGIRNNQQANDKAHQYTQMVANNQAASVVSFFEKNENVVQTLSLALSGATSILSNDLEKAYDEILLKQSSLLGDNIDTWVLWQNSFMQEGNQGAGFLVKKFSEQGLKAQQSSVDATFNDVYSSILNSNEVAFSLPFYVNEMMYINVGAPIIQANKVQGYVGVTINLAALDIIINQQLEGGFITVLSNSGTFVAHSNAAFTGKNFAENFPNEAKEYSVDDRVGKGESFDMTTPFDGEHYYSVFVPIYFGNTGKAWSVEATAPMSVLIADTKSSIIYSATLAIIVVIVLILLLWSATKRICNPIIKVTQNLKMLATGNTKDLQELDLNSKDELQEMGESLNMVVEGLQKTESFALEIGKGKLDESFEIASDKDNLGMALLDMRDSLIVNQKELAKRKLEEDRTNWSTQGIAKFSDILRQDTNNMEKLGFNVMSNLVKYLGVNQGALFVQSESEDNDEDFELVTAIAYDRSKFMKKHVKIGEGLIGRCAFEMKTIYITDIPDDYVSITSGLGTANPSCILMVPCTLNDEVYGVIELASFSVLEKHEIEFVEKLGETIASTISNVRINEKTSKLLDASQNQSEELAAHEEELRQNLEEMETTQEDLKRQMETNSAMRVDLIKQNALLDALLTSLPDYIYFKDSESKFLRISSSMLNLFDASDVSEVIGKSDFDYHTQENAQKYYNDEKEIMRSKKGFVDVVQPETLKDGSVIWNAVSKLPIITKDDECIGTFGISKNITEIKNMEIEAKKQNALLDALLTSLPDFIYFKDKESKFLRLSKSMLSLFNAADVNEVIGKSDYDYHTPENAQEYYDDEQEIIKSRKGFVDKLQVETLRDGSSIWNSVSKLPILTEDGDCIGTFGISKNITDLKKLEMEANKQSALLDALLNSLPDFIYFKDKDSKFLRISKSMLNIFNAKNVNEVIGKSDFDYHPAEAAKEYFEDEQKIIKSKKGFADKLQKEILVDGSIIWNSVSKLPIVTNEGDCIGTFGISKNVTEIKEFELEAKARNEELAAQEEELRQNLEELETVNDNNIELHEQMQQQSKMLIEVLNELPLEIYLKDAKGKFILANDYVAANYNQKAEGVIGKSDRDFYSKKDADAITKEEKEIMTSGKAKVVVENDKKNKDLLLRKIIKKPFRIEHLNETGVLGMKIDVEALRKS